VPLPELAAPVAGALCVARRRPWDAGDAERLAAQLPELAAIAAEELRHHLDAAPPGRGAEAGAADEATHRWVLRTSPDVLSFMSADLRYTWVHPGRTGLRAEDVIGRTDFDLFPREVAERLTALKREVLATGKGASVEVPVTWDGAQHLWHCVLEPRRDGRGRLVGIAGYSRDVTEAREWERRHRAQLTVGSILAEGGDAAEALRGVLETVATAFGWELAEFWRLDADAGVLRFGSAWHDPAYELGEFVERSRELTFARGVGLPGRVWERGEPVWVDDVSRDECFVRRVIPQSEVLHTAYGLPVRTADRVAGVMMFLDSTVRHPEPDLSLMAHAGLQVGQFLERAAAEEAVRQRDLRLRILLDQVPAVLWSTDAGLRFTSSRGAGLAALGLAEEQVVGMHLRDYFGMPDDAPLMQYQYRALAGESVRYEAAWAGRHFMSYVEPLRASGGEIVGTVGMGFDITERVQAEALVREKERFIERVATAVPTILYVYDILENRNVFANAEVSAILGYTPEEVRAMGTAFFPRTMHPDDLARLPERNRRFERLAEGEFVETVYRMRHASGEWRWLCSRDMVFGRSADGRPKEILGTALDITEQKQVEARLRQALRVEAMLRRVSALFVSQEQVRLDAVLEELGGTLGADRAAIVHVREPDGRLEKTHTWRAPAAPVPDRRLHDIPVDRLPWLAAQLRAGDTVSCDDVDALPDAAGAERALFRARGARAFAVSPLHSPEGRLLGLVAAESVAGAGGRRRSCTRCS
jgi:PAS domain S-box-containing protein